jgi:predicted regulator of Ras-like GTPase activity (Roadblock/LC7/MglB family)
MANPGAIGYVLINFDGIPVKHYPESLPAVQYSALISDLVMKTKSTLKQLNQADSEFNYLRMRTK